MALRFFADHCISRRIAELLSEQGHEVFRLRDYLPTDAPDSVVIASAQERGAILLSLNGDFADIVRYPPSAFVGIIALQIKNHPEVTDWVMDRLLAYLATHEDAQHYVGKLFLVEPHRIRIRD